MSYVVTRIILGSSEIPFEHRFHYLVLDEQQKASEVVSIEEPSCIEWTVLGTKRQLDQLRVENPEISPLEKPRSHYYLLVEGTGRQVCLTCSHYTLAFYLYEGKTSLV